jgi:hypothetical protein
MKKDTVIVGILSIILICIFEGSGISSLVIYSSNIHYTNTTCETEGKTFLLSYGITSIIFGVIWIALVVIVFICDYHVVEYLEKAVYVIPMTITVSLSIILIVMGLVFAAKIVFHDCKVIKIYQIYAMCLAIFGINVGICGIGFITGCGNMCYGCFNADCD